MFFRVDDDFNAKEKYKKIQNQYEIAKKTHENLQNLLKEDELLATEEYERKQEVLELAKITDAKILSIQAKDAKIKAKRDEIIALTKRLEISEKELSLKEKKYEEQKATCPDMDKIAKKHAQKFQELDTLQANYNELEAECEHLQNKMMIKTEEVKRLINCGKEVIEKIRLSSTLTLEELPEISVTDFHRKNDIIEKYKVNQ